MNDADVSMQIQQMVRFIRQESEEKANEISVSAEEEFNIEKLQLVEAEKRKIRQEYERKEKQVEIRKTIEYSMQLNASRIKVLQAQDDLVNSMKEAAGKELLHVSHHHHAYKKLLNEMIVQSLLRLKEPAVLLRCRKDDLELVESVLHSAKHGYAEKANVHHPDIIVDTHVYLPPAPSHHNAHGSFCSGGVVLASRDGKIICENTLDARLDVVFRKKLPEIRKRLFGQIQGLKTGILFFHSLFDSAQALGLPFLSPYLQSIGSNFGHGANFATLASTVLLPNTSLFVTGISPFSLAIQLNQMKDLRERVLGMSPQGYLPPKNIFSRSLYTLDIGQNDFTSNLGSIGIEGVKQYLPQVASQIAWTIKDLYEIGGRAFLVSNLAPIGCYPAFLTELPHNSSDIDIYGCMISYNNAVDDYNNLLKEALRQTREQLQDASVIYVDTHSVKLELFRHPTDHGLLYGTKACCGHGGGDYNFNPQVFCGNSKVIDGSNLTATACGDPEHYVSWDGIHATEAANKLVTWAILSGSYFDPPFPLSKLCDLQPID